MMTGPFSYSAKISSAKNSRPFLNALLIPPPSCSAASGTAAVDVDEVVELVLELLARIVVATEAHDVDARKGIWSERRLQVEAVGVVAFDHHPVRPVQAKVQDVAADLVLLVHERLKAHAATNQEALARADPPASGHPDEIPTSGHSHLAGLGSGARLERRRQAALRQVHVDEA